MEPTTKRWAERLVLVIIGGLTTAVAFAFITGAFNLTVEVRNTRDEVHDMRTSMERVEQALYQLVEPKVQRLNDPSDQLDDEKRKRFDQMRAFADWFDQQREQP